MRAAVIAPTGVEIENVTQPQAGPTGVVVRVHAAGLNRADIHSVQLGRKTHENSSTTGSDRLPAIIGGEFAGEVVQVGADVHGFGIGDRVMGLGFGAHAEFAIADAGCLYQVPNDMDYRDAAALPVALLTSYNALLLAGKFCRGEAVLIHGASSAVGLMAVQIARAVGASVVVGTSMTASRRSRLVDYGADVAVDSARPDWPSEVLAATGGQGADLIIDHVAGTGFSSTMAAASLGCRIVNVGRLGGEHGAFDFDLHALKRLKYVGVTFRTLTLDDYRAVTARIRSELWSDVVRRQLTMPIDRTFSLDSAADAYKYMAQNEYFGKILITPVA